MHKTKKNTKSYFIYFTTLDKQIIRLIMIPLVCTDVSTRGSLMSEKAALPGEN